MSECGRFQCPSASVALRSLLDPMQRRLWVGLGVAAAVHVALAQLGGWTPEQQTAKPLTTRFVKRQPRLSKPLEMKKRPRPKRRQIRREMVSVTAKARAQAVSSRVQPDQLLGSLAHPRVEMARSAGFPVEVWHPRTVAQAIGGAKESQHTLSMSLELMDVQALDTGRYHALVVQDPHDKTNIKGFLHLHRARSATDSDVWTGKAWGYQDEYNAFMAKLPQRLADVVNRYTMIRAGGGGDILYDDRAMLKMPLVLIFPSLGGGSITDSEAQGLAGYLHAGGLIFADGGWSIGGTDEKSVRRVAVDALTEAGIEVPRSGTFTHIPDRHPLYHCFFDFDGPPMGHFDRSYPHFMAMRTDYLEGVWLGERLVLVYGMKSYQYPWVMYGPQGRPAFQGLDPTRAHQFAVNVIVFALTQEGSITHRLMDTVSH